MSAEIILLPDVTSTIGGQWGDEGKGPIKSEILTIWLDYIN